MPMVAEHEWMFVRESNAGIEGGRAIAVADGDHGLDAGIARARNHVVAIGVELLAIEMGVRIDKHAFM